MALMEPGCLYERRGMTVWELEHFIRHHRFMNRTRDAEARGVWGEGGANTHSDQAGPDPIGYFSLASSIKTLSKVSFAN